MASQNDFESDPPLSKTEEELVRSLPAAAVAMIDASVQLRV
jgi:hypothetical protein